MADNIHVSQVGFEPTCPTRRRLAKPVCMPDFTTGTQVPPEGREPFGGTA